MTSGVATATAESGATLCVLVIVQGWGGCNQPVACLAVDAIEELLELRTD